MTDHLVARQLAHFDYLIRCARQLGFTDDVRHWETQKAEYSAEMSEPTDSTEGGQ